MSPWGSYSICNITLQAISDKVLFYDMDQDRIIFAVVILKSYFADTDTTNVGDDEIIMC